MNDIFYIDLTINLYKYQNKSCDLSYDLLDEKEIFCKPLRSSRIGGHIFTFEHEISRATARLIYHFYSFYKMLPISPTVRQTAAWE